jgi:hypothetical protein
MSALLSCVLLFLPSEPVYMHSTGNLLFNKTDKKSFKIFNLTSGARASAGVHGVRLQPERPSSDPAVPGGV